MRGLKSLVWAGAAALAVGAVGVSPTVRAESVWPSQMVRIVVPFSAGSVTDGLARILADRLAEIWKQQVIVENRPGLAGTTGVAKSPADGTTLMLTSNGHTIAGVINKAISFDPVKDFAGVTKVASVPMVAVVPPQLPVETLADFIALAKKDPGKLNFSSAGIASTTYLSAELLRQAAGIDIMHVPYKGTPEATTAVIRNDAQLYFAPIPMTQELAATKQVRPIAINSARRSDQLPDVPTVAETVPGYDYDSWFAVLAPAGTPRAVIAKASADIARVLALPDVIAKLKAQGAVPSPTTPEALDAQIRRETELYGRVLRDAGVGMN